MKSFKTERGGVYEICTLIYKNMPAYTRLVVKTLTCSGFLDMACHDLIIYGTILS